MMEPRIIKTENHFREALVEIERLVELDPSPETPEGERLELLATLVAKYENERFSFEMPTPIEAIQFRMKEQGLRQSDLIPYIGSKSKVSEVLSGKRLLSTQMIRALDDGLGIPAKVLLQASSPNFIEASIDWNKFPVREIIRRGWVKANIRDAKNKAMEIMEEFLKPLGDNIPTQTFLRKANERSGREMDKFALHAWTARILLREKEERAFVDYKPGVVTNELMKTIAHLSCYEKGPLLAKDCLAEHGIALIIEPHLPKTKLDGAAILSGEGRPVIGLTLRFDRIDNFWFTLMHELAHVAEHLTQDESLFYDDLQVDCINNIKEKTADKLSTNAFINRSLWRQKKSTLTDSNKIIQFAKSIKIHPAIVAGRIRKEKNNYYIFNQLVGNGQIRKYFPEIKWDLI